MPKPSPEELREEEQRSTAVGFFNIAETYRTAAKALRRSKAKATHKDSPIRFLYYHAIELYLKAHLRAHSIHPSALRSHEYGHDARKLSRKSEVLGLALAEHDKEVFRLMADTDAVIRSRYISTGYFRWPDVGALDGTCKRLRRAIAEELMLRGHRVRL